jgi:membrane-bound ClpP family serine protease
VGQFSRVADWLQWTLRFPLLFSVGVLAQFAALLAISFQSPPIVPYVLVLVGMVSLAVGGIRLWRVSLMAFDVAVGACLEPVHELSSK